MRAPLLSACVAGVRPLVGPVAVSAPPVPVEIVPGRDHKGYELPLLGTFVLLLGRQNQIVPERRWKQARLSAPGLTLWYRGGVRTEDPRNWASSPDAFELDAHTVHVWRIPLDQPERCIEQLSAWLSADERDRAERFHFDRDRNRFVVGRAATRAILARCLKTTAGEVRFTYGPQGKPSLVNVPGPLTLYFNLAHSQALALLAVARDREVGVDVEAVRRLLNADQIVERFFSRREVDVYRHIAEPDRPEAFFRCWTRKEAYLKALGTGLSTPLDAFDVSLMADDPRLLHVADHPEEVARWSMRELRPEPGYLAAIIAEGSDWSLSCWHWDAERELLDRGISHS